MRGSRQAPPWMKLGGLLEWVQSRELSGKGGRGDGGWGYIHHPDPVGIAAIFICLGKPHINRTQLCRLVALSIAVLNMLQRGRLRHGLVSFRDAPLPSPSFFYIRKIPNLSVFTLSKEKKITKSPHLYFPFVAAVKIYIGTADVVISTPPRTEATRNISRALNPRRTGFDSYHVIYST